MIVALLVAATPTRAQHAQTIAAPRPPSGIGGLIVGWAGLGTAVANAALLPICFADFYPSSPQWACLATSGLFISGGAAAAIAGLTIGYPRRARYKRWRAARLALDLEGFRFSSLPGGGAAVGYSARF